MLNMRNSMKRNKDKKEKFVDDGRTIANMNVDGMPWYNPSKDAGGNRSAQDFSDLTKKEKRAMMGGILAAALLVGAIFIGGALLFIVFCTNIWFA